MTKNTQNSENTILKYFPYTTYPSQNFILKQKLFADHTNENGGGGRDRTDDLKLAKLPLSQLSYSPINK